MIAQNATLVVEDLARDRRLPIIHLSRRAGSVSMRARRCAAQAVLRSDHSACWTCAPRKMTEHELRVLESFAEDFSEELKSRVSQTNATTPTQLPDTDKMSAVP